MLHQKFELFYIISQVLAFEVLNKFLRHFLGNIIHNTLIHRTRLPIPNSDALSLFMPAFVGAQDGNALAIKVVSLFPENPSRGLAYIQAAVLVFDSQTGQAIALLEGSSLTAIRTGAASGADPLSRLRGSGGDPGRPPALHRARGWG